MDRSGLMISDYLFRRREMVYIPEAPEGTEKTDPVVVFGFAMNLREYGYHVSADAVRKLMELDEQTVTDIYERLIENAKEAVGADVEHVLLFENFPESCHAMTQQQLSDTRFVSYLAQFIDIFTGSSLTRDIEWDGARIERSRAQTDSLRVINAGSRDDLAAICTNLLSGRTGLSDDDKELITFVLTDGAFKDRKDLIPKMIPYKDTQAFLTGLAVDGRISYSPEFTAVKDFLRAVYASKGLDIQDDPKLPSFTNKERNYFMNALEASFEGHGRRLYDSLLDKDARQRFLFVTYTMWHMHSKKMAGRYPRIREAVINTEGRYSRLAHAEMLLEKAGKDPDHAVKAARAFMDASPGYVISYLTKLAVIMPEKDFDAFLDIVRDSAQKSSITVLMRTRAAIENGNDVSAVFPGGGTKGVHLFERKNMIPEERRGRITEILTESIREKFRYTEPAGKIYIDPGLADCPVPFAGKTFSGETRAVEKGTSFPVDKNADVLRAFCYKKAKPWGGGFYDLSASLLDKDFALLEHCSWTNLKMTVGGRDIGVHSGDDMSSNTGCTEMIDIDKKALKELVSGGSGIYREGRYIAFQVFAYNGIPPCDMERVFFGVMDRKGVANDRISKRDMETLIRHKVRSAHYDRKMNYYFQVPPEHLGRMQDYTPEKAFDPATVSHRFDLTGKHRTNITMLYDIKKDKVIVADLSIGRCAPEDTFPKRKAGLDRREKGSFVPLEDVNLYAGAATPMVETMTAPTAKACYACVHMNRAAIKDLAEDMAAGSGSVLTDDINEADLVFAVDRPDTETDKRYITPFDRDVIVSELLSPVTEDMFVESCRDKIASCVKEYEALGTQARELLHEGPLKAETLEKYTEKMNARTEIIKKIRQTAGDPRLPEYRRRELMETAGECFRNASASGKEQREDTVIG